MNSNASDIHLSDEDLVLHYYGEMPAAEEAAAAAHLGTCGVCRAEYTRLQRVLGAVEETSLPHVELPPSFERTVWARLEPNLRKERRGWTSWLWLAPAPLALAATVVVLVAAAFFAGRAMGPAPPGPPAADPAASADQIRERVLLVDLGEHLDRSQTVLVELASVDEAGNVDISLERARAEQLVADSRLYRMTAEQAGDPALTDLLDEVERVLTDIAASPGTVSGDDLAEVQRRIESRDLLFKLRVVSSAIRDRQKEPIRRQSGQRS
jgi:hypothetical protein